MLQARLLREHIVALCHCTKSIIIINILYGFPQFHQLVKVSKKKRILKGFKF